MTTEPDRQTPYPATAATASAPPPVAPRPPVPGERTGLAILLMCVVSFIFAVQDGLSRGLGRTIRR